MFYSFSFSIFGHAFSFPDFICISITQEKIVEGHSEATHWFRRFPPLSPSKILSSVRNSTKTCLLIIFSRFSSSLFFFFFFFFFCKSRFFFFVYIFLVGVFREFGKKWCLLIKQLEKMEVGAVEATSRGRDSQRTKLENF